MFEEERYFRGRRHVGSEIFCCGWAQDTGRRFGIRNSPQKYMAGLWAQVCGDYKV